MLKILVVHQSGRLNYRPLDEEELLRDVAEKCPLIHLTFVHID